MSSLQAIQHDSDRGGGRTTNNQQILPPPPIHYPLEYRSGPAIIGHLPCRLVFEKKNVKKPFSTPPFVVNFFRSQFIYFFFTKLWLKRSRNSSWQKVLLHFFFLPFAAACSFLYSFHSVSIAHNNNKPGKQFRRSDQIRTDQTTTIWSGNRQKAFFPHFCHSGFSILKSSKKHREDMLPPSARVIRSFSPSSTSLPAT